MDTFIRPIDLLLGMIRERRPIEQVFTHVRLDLDAICSLWTLRKFGGWYGTPTFVPSGWDGEGFDERTMVALDIDVRGKGIKNDGLGNCCFAVLVARLCNELEQEALELLVEFVQGQDTGNGTRAILQGIFGDPLSEGAARAATKLHPLSINSVLNSMRRGIGMTDDEGLTSLFFPVLDGWYQGSRDYVEARINAFVYAKKLRTRMACPHGDAYIVENNPSGIPVNGILFDSGAAIIVYRERNNLGVLRRDDIRKSLDHKAVHKLVDDEPGWFFHPGGFLVARGTRKSPSDSPSRINPEDLARVALKAIQ